MSTHVLLGLTLLVEASALWPPAFRLTDHLIFWNVGRLLLAGRSPYDPSAWSDAAAVYENVNIRAIVDGGGVVWPYPPWTGYLFVPFGILPPEFGLAALHAAYLAVGVAAGVALARYFRWRSATTYALALLIVPTAVVNGQWTFLLLATTSATLLLVRASRPRAAAFAAPGWLAKPQLFIG